MIEIETIAYFWINKMGRDVLVNTVFAVRLDLEGIIDLNPDYDEDDGIALLFDAIRKFTGKQIDNP